VTHGIPCMAGVKGEGEEERERRTKMGFWELGTRECLLQKPPFFHLRPLIFRCTLFCMTDFTQEFNEVSTNKVRTRIFCNQRITYIEQHSISFIFKIRDRKLF